MGKILLIAVIVVSVLTAGVGFLNRGKILEAQETIANEQLRTQSLQQEVAETRNSLEEAQTTAAEAEEAKQSLQSQLNTANSQLENVRTELNQSKQLLEEKEKSVTDLQEDMRAKDVRIAELEAAGTGAAAVPDTDTAQMQERLGELEAREAEQETLIARLQSDLSSARSQVEELRENERRRAAQQMRRGLEGRILAVNQGWNFVVLSLGDRNGVVSNAEMLVKRGNQLIGKVRITSVEPTNSIADIVVNSVPSGMTIQPGDTVIYSADND